MGGFLHAKRALSRSDLIARASRIPLQECNDNGESPQCEARALREANYNGRVLPAFLCKTATVTVRNF